MERLFVRRRSILSVLIALLLAALLAWEFVPIQVMRWSGGYDLAITVKNAGAEPIIAVSCQAFGWAEHAEETMRHLRLLESNWSASAKPFQGKPLILAMPTGGRVSPMGRELSRFQPRHLVVIAEFGNGKRVGKLVEIPDVEVSRSMEVWMP